MSLLRHFTGNLRLANTAWISVLAALALSILGLHAIDTAEGLRGLSSATGATVPSATTAAATPATPTTPAPTTLLGFSGTALKQLVFLFIGIGAALLIALPKYKLLGYASWILAALNILLLGVLLVPGVPDWIVTPRNGARAWISLGPVDLQPSEPAKIVFVLVLAWYMRFREEHRTFRGLVLIGALSIAPIALIMLQPDLGQAMLFIPPLLAIFLAAGAKKRHLFAVLAAALLAAPATYPFLMPHQKARIVGLVKQIQGDRTADEDVNMQPVTAQRLIGAGGLTGAGEDLSRALIHYNRLPERHNDMVFSVVVNRWGMMGGLAVIGLSLTWIVGALATAAAAKDPFARLICVGASGFLVGHLIVNVGMNLGLLPIVGVTLPFVSYGGSSLLTMWVMTGLILNVGLRRPRAPGRPSFEYAGGDDD